MNLLSLIGVNKREKESPTLPDAPANPIKIDWVHSQIDSLDDNERSLCTAFANFSSGTKSKQCAELVMEACAPLRLEIPPMEALVELARESGGVWGSNVDALTDDEFAGFVRQVLMMALQVLARDVARDWIERLHIEHALALEPSA